LGSDEGIVGKLIGVAGVEEVVPSSEEDLLVLEEIDDFKSRARGEIEELGCSPSGVEALVDALELGVDVKDVHSHVVEQWAIVREGSVAERGARDGGDQRLKKANSVARV